MSKIIPHNIDAEQALLACCIIEGAQKTIATCIELKLNSDYFFKQSHKIIFESLIELYNEGIPVDEIILLDKLLSKNKLKLIGDKDYITKIINTVDNISYFNIYLNRIKELYLLRRLIYICSETIDKCYQQSSNIEQLLSEVEESIFSISKEKISDTIKHISFSIDKFFNKLSQSIDNKNFNYGLSSGFKDIDQLISGFSPQEMTIIAARPSMGKTSIILNIASSLILKKEKEKRVSILIFSLEMSAEQLAMRMICSIAKINIQDMRSGNLKQILNFCSEKNLKFLKNLPLWIDESSSLSILEIRAKARRLASKENLGMIIIDYLQLISGTDIKISREQQISEISRGLKAMARELNIPVIVAAQLNRESEREKRQPKLSDLRESGSIEQDADIVMLIANSSNEEFNISNEENIIRNIIIAKQRNGPTGTVKLIYNKKYTSFENYK